MNTIGYFEIQANEPEKSIEFYTNVFGWRFTERTDLPIRYWLIETDGIGGGLLERPAKNPPSECGTNAFTCSFEVADFDATAETILTNGGQIAMAKFEIPGRCWQGYFLDTNNNVFGIFEVVETNKNTDKGENIMAKINPYLHFLGNSEKVFNFYKSVFGGEFAMVQRYGEMPGGEEMKLAEEDKSKIMHIALPISDGHVLMATDAIGEHAKDAVIGNNISLSVGADSKEEAEKIFNGLAEGGNVTMPIADTFWGAYFGMLKDKFGISWMVNYDYPKES